MGSKAGAMKRVARLAGVTPEEYARRVDAGRKFCWRCKRWHRVEAFGLDASRGDGRDPSCQRSRRAYAKATYRPTTKPARPGPRRIPRRSGDKLQARSRINHDVDLGLRPRPNELPCTDCGHVWKKGERRHEYDHHLGYEAEHHGDVEAVCSRCHSTRERKRRNG